MRIGPVVLLVALLWGCGDTDSEPREPTMLWASELVEFQPGPGAGYGQEDLPDVVFGPPRGNGPNQGGLEVLSLGDRGSITLAFDRDIVDGDGPDFVIFENPFYIGGDATQVFAELGRVSVSQDLETWHSFECDIEAESPGQWPGCAGWTPTLEFDSQDPTLTPEDTGGNHFDLSDLGIERIRYVRVEDLQGEGAEPVQGFDLDAVGAFPGAY